MKKKIIISIIICLIIVIGLISYNIWDNRVVSIITLDINPSIEIKLNRKEKVVSVVALNSDAKEVISNDLKGKKLDKALDNIVENLIEKEYVNDKNLVDIVLYSNGNISNNSIKNKLSKSLGDNNIQTNIIVVKKITKEDKELAKKYDISPAKIEYIKTAIKEKEKINIEDLIDKSVSEIKETKETGKYCDKEYILEGDWCLKEIETTAATTGEICPEGYLEYEGICYEEKPIEDTGELYCNEGFILEKDKCVSNEKINANPNYVCTTGELIRKDQLWTIGISDGDKMVCVDKSTGQKPKLRCMISKSHLEINGKCYNGPAPLIGGGCPDGGLQRNGGCYTLDNEDQWECPNGNIYHKSQNSVPDVCPDTLTYTEPTITGYSCDEEYTLEGTKCVPNRTEDPVHKRACPSGYTLINNDRCINKNDIKEKEKGFICKNEEDMLKGNKCISYERIAPKQSN